MPNTIKRSIKLSISIVFLLVSYIGDILRRLTGKAVPGNAIILYYHGIRPEQRSQFARQMDTLLRWAKPVGIGFKSHLKEGVRFAAVTFDDGFESFIYSALPELEKREIPATLFVVTERLGCYPDWDEYIEDPLFREKILTLDQLRELPPALVTIGSHTLTHPFLTRIGECQAKRELRESRIQLERMLDRKVTLFSFPHGAFHKDLVDWCRESGYEQVFTILPEPAFLNPNKFAVGRVGTGPSDWPLEFWLKLLGAYCWLPFAFNLKRKMLAIPLVRVFTDLRFRSNVG